MERDRELGRRDDQSLDAADRAELVKQPLLGPDDSCLVGTAPEELVEGRVDVP